MALHVGTSIQNTDTSDITPLIDDKKSSLDIGQPPKPDQDLPPQYSLTDLRNDDEFRNRSQRFMESYR